MSSHFTIAPISQNPKSDSHLNYIDQLLLSSTNDKYKLKWDDSVMNKSEKGDFFVFYFHEKRCIVHQITDVKSHEHGSNTWSNRGRNVVELSQALGVISWTSWQTLRGPESKQCSYTTMAYKYPYVYAFMETKLAESYLGVVFDDDLLQHVNFSAYTKHLIALKEIDCDDTRTLLIEAYTVFTHLHI